MQPDKRLNALETKVAFLEKAHEELSEVVYGLSQDLAKLTAKIDEMRNTPSQPGEPPRSLEDDKPPHY